MWKIVEYPSVAGNQPRVLKSGFWHPQAARKHMQSIDPAGRRNLRIEPV